MKVKDMVENINFHDSNVIELSYENNIVKLKLDLCMWQQKEYKERDGEISIISFKCDRVDFI